ncbi:MULTISPECIES: ABC transporter substrate-binding protein [Paenibacillus]|uniref:Peptide/nickel transport system substrate-binding protein n=1 Tax=Paenibacillus pabuli TaxID=1472 RepID=A0A855XPD2_9BACL|nr:MULTISPECIES: ABC transporter substrate-binding protein [Paenibacillus]PWW36119.1 peptide/nickel transport system substrate-binding protein [Paenibacillus pabuli]PXW03198.1 peptide/nickel transport system substrate-binding protein [Paenibacillus taichungensis]
MKRVRKAWIGGVLTLLMVLVTACGSNSGNNTTSSPGADGESASASGGSGQPLYIGLVNPVTTFDVFNLDNAGVFVNSLMSDTLVAMNSKYGFDPKLAESIETTDNQNFTIKLNKKAKWSDGEPFTADDVEFTFRMFTDVNVKTLLNMTFVTGLNEAGKREEGQTELGFFERIDDYTFVIKTKNPMETNQFKSQFGTYFRFLPEHVLKNVAPVDLNKNEFMMNPTVTNGAYKFVKFAKDQYVQMTANEQYYEGAPNIKEIYIKMMPATNLAAQLQTGDIQLTSPGVGLIPVQDFEKVANMANVTTGYGDANNPNIMFINTKKFPDPKVRQAIAYAMNRQLIVDQLLKGQGELVDGMLGQNHPYYNKDISLYGYNPEKAKALLKEAAWDLNQTIEFVVPTGNKIREQAADIISENLKAVGLKVQVTKLDFPTTYQRALKHDYDLTIMNLGFILDPNSVLGLFKTGVSFNISDYSSTEVDELLVQGAEELEPTKRFEIYKQVQQMLHDDVPVIALFADKQMYAAAKNLDLGKGLETSTVGLTNNVAKWTFTP